MKVILSFILALLVCVLVWQESQGFSGISRSFTKTTLSLIPSFKGGNQRLSHGSIPVKMSSQPEGFQDSKSYLAYLETQAALPQVPSAYLLGSTHLLRLIPISCPYLGLLCSYNQANLRALRGGQQEAPHDSDPHFAG